jgi:hypothetical protein
MAKVTAWTLFALGLAHIAVGLLRFRQPLLGALQDGFVGQFSMPERRAAFWFLLAGPLLMLMGQMAVQAVDKGQLGQLRLIGFYLLPTSVIGVAAFPASPLWMLLLLSGLLIAVSYGWLR